MRRTFLCVLGFFTLNILLHCGHAQDSLLTIEPNWSILFTGESVTFICDMREGKDTDWYYTIRKDGQEVFSFNTNKNHTLQLLTTGYSGEYQCVGHKVSIQFRRESNKVSLTVSDKDVILENPASTLYEGESVTLRCRHRTQREEKNAAFYKDGSLIEMDSNHQSPIISRNTAEITIQPLSDGSSYKCKFDEDEESEPIKLKLETQRPKAELRKDKTHIPAGGSVTLTCSVSPPSSGWKYFWYRGKKTSEPLTTQDVVFLSNEKISVSQGGLYWCRGGRGNPVYYTEYSDSIDKPQPVLTVSPSWLSPGASVTLNCSVKDPSAGWRFYWYKAVPKLSDYYYSYELLPGSIKGTEQDSYIVHGQTHTARYVCRAGRGDPVYYTLYSRPKFVWSGDFHSAASLTVSPDRVQHFTSESVSLSCEGNSAEWRVRRFSKYGFLTDCSSWGTMTGSTCNISRSQNIDAVYWCESESGQFSNAVNITGQHSDMILVSPVHPVAEGDSVTLGCKLRTENVLANVDFYKNGKLIQTDTRRELTIPAVSKSDEGFYKCKGKDSRQSWRSWTSPKSWMSVKTVSEPESSPFPVLLIVGLVCGVLLIILLLLFLYRYRKSKDSCFIRSQSTNQGSAADHMINQDETQCKDASLLNGDVSLYETIKGPEEPEHDEFSDVTYSLIELKNIAQKGKSSPAAADETVYSEVKPGTTLGNNAPIT